MTRRDWVWRCLAIALFLLCSAPWLSLPGPYADELLFVNAVEPYANGFPSYSWTWDGGSIPIMLMSYVGALKSIVLGAVLAVLPGTIETVRGFTITLGVLTLALTAAFVRNHYPAIVAAGTVLVLATEASFLHTIRIDWGPVALMHLLKMSGLLSLSIWLSTARLRWLVVGMFSFGLALWDKANFVWFLFALAVAVMVVFPRELLRRIDRRTVAVASAAFLLGALPLLVFNIQRRGVTASDTSRFEYHPAKLTVAKMTLDGSAVLWLTTRNGLDDTPAEAEGRTAQLVRWLGVARSNLTWPLMVCGLLALPWTLGGPRGRGLLFVLILSVVNYAVMFPFAGGGGGAHHVAMLYPFPIVFAVGSLAAVTERWKARRVFGAVVTAVLVVNLSLNARYLAGFVYTGGFGSFSDSIYRLAAHAAKEPGSTYYFLDWGVGAPFALLSHASKTPFVEEGWLYEGAEPPGGVRSRVNEILADRESRLVVRGEDTTVFPGGREIVESLWAEGRLRKVAEVHERTGAVAFEVYKATK